MSNSFPSCGRCQMIYDRTRLNRQTIFPNICINCDIKYAAEMSWIYVNNYLLNKEYFTNVVLNQLLKV